MRTIREEHRESERDDFGRSRSGKAKSSRSTESKSRTDRNTPATPTDRAARPEPKPDGRDVPINEAIAAAYEDRPPARSRPDRPRVATLAPSGSTGQRGAKAAKAKRPRVVVPVIERAPLPTRPRHIEDLGTSLTRELGASRAGRARSDIDAAVRAYSNDRYTESRRLMDRLAKLVPDIAEVRELNGLSAYRLGRWPAAIAELEAFRELAGSAEQNAVLADCYRAVRRWDDVDALWDELREVSPNAAVVTEGRIVAAGSLADRGDLAAGLRLLEKGWRTPARPHEYHLRRAYAIGDLYERSGSPVRARELFVWVAGVDPEFGDVQERLRQLG